MEMDFEKIATIQNFLTQNAHLRQLLSEQWKMVKHSHRFQGIDIIDICDVRLEHPFILSSALHCWGCAHFLTQNRKWASIDTNKFISDHEYNFLFAADYATLPSQKNVSIFYFFFFGSLRKANSNFVGKTLVNQSKPHWKLGWMTYLELLQSQDFDSIIFSDVVSWRGGGLEWKSGFSPLCAEHSHFSITRSRRSLKCWWLLGLSSKRLGDKFSSVIYWNANLTPLF